MSQLNRPTVRVVRVKLYYQLLQMNLILPQVFQRNGLSEFDITEFDDILIILSKNSNNGVMSCTMKTQYLSQCSS